MFYLWISSVPPSVDISMIWKTLTNFWDTQLTSGSFSFLLYVCIIRLLIHKLLYTHTALHQELQNVKPICCITHYTQFKVFTLAAPLFCSLDRTYFYKLGSYMYTYVLIVMFLITLKLYKHYN